MVITFCDHCNVKVALVQCIKDPNAYKCRAHLCLTCIQAHLERKHKGE